MKVCPTYGPGFFYIPGTDQCIKVGGRVRADYVAGSAASAQVTPVTRADALNVFRARAYLYMDQRQNTEYGLLRTYGRLSFTGDNAAGGTALFEFAYIQLGGFTFGKFQSPYENVYYSNGWIPYGLNGEGAMDNTSGNGLAYTASLGNGVTATLAIRAGDEIRSAPTTAGITNINASGQAAPDGVAAVEIAQSWGKAKLSGAVHQVRYNNITGVARPSTDYGYGGSLGIQINLPMIAAGDFIGVSGQYSNGAAMYGGAGTFRGGQSALAIPDAVATAAGVSKLTKVWSVNGGFDHYWTKTVDTNIFAGYASAENSLAGAGTSKANHYTIGQYTKWTPIAGLQIGIETDYRKNGGGAVRQYGIATGGKVTELSDWSGRLRVQRDF